MAADQVQGAIEDAADCFLAKYLTTQSGFMAMIFLILVPFVKTMLTSDFVTLVPLENIIGTITILSILGYLNLKDKAQEHTTAAAQLSNPKVIDNAIDSFTKMSESLKKMQLDEIKIAVKDCMRELNMEAKSCTPTIIEKIVEVPVEKIIYVPMTDNNTGE